MIILLLSVVQVAVAALVSFGIIITERHKTWDMLKFIKASSHTSHGSVLGISTKFCLGMSIKGCKSGASHRSQDFGRW